MVIMSNSWGVPRIGVVFERRGGDRDRLVRVRAGLKDPALIPITRLKPADDAAARRGESAEARISLLGSDPDGQAIDGTVDAASAISFF